MRDKLVADGKVKKIVLGEDHDERVVTGKILKLFPNLLLKDNSPPFRYMHASSSGDIICAELPEGHSGWDGDAVCSIAEGSNVYIKPASTHISGQNMAPGPSQPTTPILGLGQVPLRAIGPPNTHRPTAPHRVPGPSVSHPLCLEHPHLFHSHQFLIRQFLSHHQLLSHLLPPRKVLSRQPIQQSPQIGDQYVMGPRVFAVVVGSDNQPAGKPGKVIVLLLEFNHNEPIE